MKNLRKVLSSTQWLWSSITNNAYLPIWWAFSVIIPVLSPAYIYISIFFYDVGFFLFCRKNKNNQLLKFYGKNSFSKGEADLTYIFSHLACLGATGLLGSVVFLLSSNSVYSTNSETWVWHLVFRSAWGFLICFLFTTKQKEKTIFLLSLLPSLLIFLNIFTSYKMHEKLRYLFSAFIPNIDVFNKTDFLMLLPLIFTMIILVVKKNEYTSSDIR